MIDMTNGLTNVYLHTFYLSFKQSLHILIVECVRKKVYLSHDYAYSYMFEFECSQFIMRNAYA